jgi:hypothetical protein
LLSFSSSSKTAVDPIPRIKAMFELTGKPEMWSAGRNQINRAQPPCGAAALIKLHPGALIHG